MAAALFEGFAELPGQHGFFLPCLDPIAEDDQADSGDALPAVNGQRSADSGQIDSGINGMPEIRVGAGADEFVALFESNSGAPILSQVPAGPESDGDTDPCERDARGGDSVGLRENVAAKNGDLRRLAEEQDKAKNFQKKDSVTRGEGFLAEGATRLQRARRPVGDKDDPRTFN